MLKERNNSNIQILDSLRAFAALSVCFYHFVCTTTDYIKTDWILNIFSIGKYGVQLFFVISGFVIPWAMYNAGFEFKNFFTFLLKRLARLEPPYFFSIIIALAILFMREKFLGLENTHIEISGAQVLLHFGYLIPFFNEYKWLNEVYWTLAIEFQYYFFMAILFIPLVKSKLFYRIIIYLSILALSFWGKDSFLPFWLPVFLVGILLFLFKAQLIGNKEYYISNFLLFAFCFYRYPFASVIYMSIPVFFVLFLQEIKISMLHYLGKMSYSIYLIHPLIGASLINVLSHSVHSSLGKCIVICSGIISTLLASYIMYRVIEKPSKSLSASIVYKK